MRLLSHGFRNGPTCGLHGRCRAPHSPVLHVECWPPPAPSTPAPVEVTAVKRIAPHLSDEALDQQLGEVVANEQSATAAVLDHIAEYDARKLFRPAGYSSMFAYCVDKLHLSEVAAYKRIRAARAARRFPSIFDAVARGRLHLTAVVTLAPYLIGDAAEALLKAATHKTKAEIEHLLAERFPRPDLPTRIQPILPGGELTPGSVVPHPLTSNELTPGSVGAPELTPGPVDMPCAPLIESERARVEPLAPQRFALQCTIDRETHDALRYAQELLGQEVPLGDVAKVIGLALQALIPQLEKRRFCATVQPRVPGPASRNARYVPTHVRRAVWERDGAQCTFVSEDGHRCEERRSVELDHIEP